MTAPLVSIVVPCYNGADSIPPLIEGLKRTRFDRFEVIVVDNESTDGTAKAAAAALAGAAFDFRIVRREGDHKLAGARNAGFREARGEFVVFVDDDVRLPWPEWLELSTEFMSSHPDAGMVGPAVLNPEGETLQFGGLWGRFHGFFRDPLAGRPYASIPKTPLRVDSLVGPILIARRSVLLAAGPWDESFDPIMFEETDMLWRIANAGAGIYWLPGVRVIHEGHLSFQRHPKDYVLTGFARHCLRSILKNASMPMVPFEVGFAAATLAAMHPSRAPGALLNAFSWNLRNLDDTKRRRAESRALLNGRVLGKATG